MDQALLDGEAVVWPPNRLTLRKKLAFAIGGTPAQVSGTVIGFFLTPFLLDVVGMRALNVAHILLVARICDAFSDPLVGWLTDRTKSRCAAAGSLCLPPRHRAEPRLGAAGWGGGGRGCSPGCCRAPSPTPRCSSRRSSSASRSTPSRKCARTPPPHPPAACPSQLLGLRA